MNHMRSNFMLLMAAFIWGCAFVAQSVSMDFIGPWTFTCIRSVIGGITLLAVMPLLDRIRHTPPEVKTMNNPVLLQGGVHCGIILALASMAQQVGIQYTTAGKAGFITALYVVLVPVLSIFLGKKTRGRIWISALIAVVGLYFLSIHGSFVLQVGDLWLILCAFLFAIHILVIDHYGPLVDGVRMSAIQFLVAGAVCLIPMLLLEHPNLSSISSAAVPILYAGICSSGMGYTLQIVGQKDADPTIASMLLSLESVFAVLAGFVLIQEVLSVRELFGCALMFAAVILSQLPERTTKKVS